MTHMRQFDSRTLDNLHAQLHAELRWKRLNSSWAKLEILLGLIAIGIGIVAAQTLTGAEPWSSAPT